MALTWSNVWHAVAITAVLAFVLGWTMCWVTAMRYGAHVGRFALRREQSQRPLVAMTRIPRGISQAVAHTQDPTPEEAAELARTWDAHPVLRG